MLPPSRASRRASSHPRGRGESWWGQQWAAKFSLLHCGVGKPSPLSTSPALFPFHGLPLEAGTPGTPGGPLSLHAALPRVRRSQCRVAPSPHLTQLLPEGPGPGGLLAIFLCTAPLAKGHRHSVRVVPLCPTAAAVTLQVGGVSRARFHAPIPSPCPQPWKAPPPARPPPRVCPEGPGGRPGLSTHLAACGLPGSRDSAEGVARPGGGTGAPVKQPDGVAVQRTIGR